MRTKGSWKKDETEQGEEMKVLQLANWARSCACSFISPTVRPALLHFKDHCMPGELEPMFMESFEDVKYCLNAKYYYYYFKF